jgi:hypothetical protein
MQTERGKAFVDNEPELTETEIESARQRGKIAVSLKGKPVLVSIEHIGFLAVKFALANGEFETVLLDRIAGEALRQLFQSLKQIEWKTDSMRPGPGRH